MEAEQKKLPILRYLRILVSAACLLVCVLLIALWVRSYSYIDTAICYRGGNWYGITSEPGRLRATFMNKAGVSDGWFFRAGMPVDDQFDPIVFRWLDSFRSVVTVHCAHWLVAIPFAVIATVLWIKWRFGLRALLMGITLVAVVMGLIAAVL